MFVYHYLLLFFTDTATTEIYTYRHTLSLHDALPILDVQRPVPRTGPAWPHRRHLHHHPRQRRDPWPLARLPRQQGRLERRDAHHRPRRVARLPVRGPARRHVDVPLRHRPGPAPPRTRTVRRDHHQPARPPHLPPPTGTTSG